MIDLPCPQADWPRFSALLECAMDMRDAERGAWLAGLSDDDARLRPTLERMFDGTRNPETDMLLSPPSFDSGGFRAGDMVGPYCLDVLLGAGGMGEVWRASRADDGPKREVALKLPHASLLDGPLRQRFARERDVLAALSHPHIAQLYDAGISADGHPYLALELVDGEPISDAARTRRIDLEQRIDLIRQVLSAISFAHQRLIVHRDIKPANVLLTPDGDSKLLDFGIAKLLGADMQPDLALTGAVRLATPAYAAPEQLSGGAITVGTDVFSVAILLFELCTGHRPFTRVPADIGEPAAPLASQRADAKAAGMSAKTPLARRLRGDLDAIIACALCLDPAARYSSAAAFGEDLDRWRRGVPVRARRIGWLTRTQKFARRNKLGVALSAILALSLAVGTAGVAWQARRAEMQATRATAIKDFMISLFAAGDPHGGAKQPDEMTARELLDRGADRAEAAFAHDIPAKIELFATLGQIYDEFDSDRAIKVWSRRLALARQLSGDDDPTVLNDSMDLAESLSQTLDYESARAELNRDRPHVLRRFGDSSLAWARWLTERSDAIRNLHGMRDETIGNLGRAIAIFRASGLSAADATSVDAYLRCLYLLELQQADAEQYDAALGTVRDMRAILVRFTPNDPVNLLSYLITQATILEHQGKLDEADADYVTIQQQSEHLVGRDSQLFQSALVHRAQLAGLRGDRAGAQALFDTMGGKVKNGHGLARRIYAAFLVSIGRGAEAVAPLQVALAAVRKQSQDEDTERRIEAALGTAQAQAGDMSRARATLRSARDAFLRWGVPGTAATLEAEERWASFLLQQGEIEAAATEYRAVLAQSGGMASASASLALAGLARAAIAEGHVQQADRFSRSAIDLLGRVTAEYDVRARIEVWAARAETFLALGSVDTARPLAEKAAAAADRYCGVGSVYTLRMHALLAETASGRKPE